MDNKIFKQLGWMGLAASVALLSACGSTNESVDGAETAAQTNKDYRCEKITVTGSRMPVRKCTTQAQRDRDEREAQRLLSSGRVASESGG